MNGESPDIKQANLQKLKELFPALFVESQLDWEKMKAAFGDNINFANEPQKVIALDSLFTGNDQLKTNTVQQMHDAGVDYKTI
ncbi:MAG TPA: hypothetical protein VI584_02975 [Nitrospiria bacterium]|nr:hypothetical protein [Nitrospiria bacterium]